MGLGSEVWGSDLPFSFLFLKNLFIYLLLAVLGLQGPVWGFSSGHEWGLFLVAGVMQSSPGSGFSCCRVQALGRTDFSSCGTKTQ